MDRLIIESIEGRITLGITMFVAIMILIGWVAINEPGRMAEFVEQHEGRSIERGAELFAANCSSCHGINGYGIGGRAPALNSPHFFGYNYLDEVNNQIASFERDLIDINGVVGVDDVPDQIGTLELLQTRQNELLDQIAAVSDEEARDLLVELGHVDAQLNDDLEEVVARIEAIEADDPIGEDTLRDLSSSELEERLQALRDNIPTRLVEADLALNGDGETEGLYAQRDALLDELNGAMRLGYFPLLEAAEEFAQENDYPFEVTNYIATDANRLTQIAFGGSLEDYITTTLIHGRPGSGDVWNDNIMVAWSQRAGGALRDDQIADIVSYILNWDKGTDWEIGDFNAVGQYAIIHAPYTGEGNGVETVGTDVDAILADFPEGDVANGEALYSGAVVSASGQALGCAGCHNGGAVGPATEGTWTRVQQQRLADPLFEGYTGIHYLVESIVRPNDYIVPTYSEGVMLAVYGDQLSIQDLADIVAFLETQNQ